MSENRPDDPQEAARKAREERLAAALRANLRRRKIAARAGAVPGSAVIPDGPVAEGEEPG